MGREDRSRSRQRDRKKKTKRSRSEESADKSRDREKRRRRAQRDFMQKHGGSKTKQDPKTGSKTGMFWDGFQWIPTDGSNNQQNSAAQAVRKMKRLYIGNVPSGTKDDQFRMALIEKMRETDIIGNDRDSEGLQLLIWIHADAQYGFVELETVEMAEAVLAKLDGMLVNDGAVQFRRPNDQGAVKSVPGMPQPAAAPAVPLALQNAPVCTSRIIQIEQAMIYDAVKTEDEDYQDTFEDMVDGCGEHGKVNTPTARIIRPEHMNSIREGGFTDDQIQPGHVFLEFISIGDASEVIRKMQNRKYDGRFLRFSSFPEDKFFEVIVGLNNGLK